jgi:hypothetical protein
VEFGIMLYSKEIKWGVLELKMGGIDTMSNPILLLITLSNIG